MHFDGFADAFLVNGRPPDNSQAVKDARTVSGLQELLNYTDGYGWRGRGLTVPYFRLMHITTHDVYEHTRQAHQSGERSIGLTISVVAVLLAVSTMLDNRANTAKVVLETKTADWWAYSHSNDTNSKIFAANARLAASSSGGNKDLAEEFAKESEQQKKNFAEAQQMAQELERQSAVYVRKANYFEIAELFLQTSIVLCSVALLTTLRLFWKLSFLSTFGTGLVISGLVTH